MIDCTLDSANSVVTATLPHFSKYMIVNRTKWLEIWETNLNYSKYDSYNIVYAIDCSGSMEDLDPEPNASGTAGVSGFHAHIMWKITTITLPYALDGELKTHEKYESGVVKRIMENVTTFYDFTSKWICRCKGV